MARRRYLKSRRLGRYNLLIRNGMLPIEAHEFSKMTKHVPPNGGRKQYPPALVEIVKGRRVLLDGFRQLADDMGWGRTRRESEYRRMVIGDYRSLSRKHTGNFFVSKDVHGKSVLRRLNPWALYDSVFSQLPMESRWDTPRSSRRQTADTKTFKSVERYKVKQLKSDVAFFQDKIDRGADPHGEFAWRKKGAEYQLRTGDYSQSY